jgi:hypothetical protein
VRVPDNIEIVVTMTADNWAFGDVEGKAID